MTEEVRCRLCGRWIGAYTPDDGDGTALRPRPHKDADGTWCRGHVQPVVSLSDIRTREPSLRPLRRLGSGAWDSADGHWQFRRHENDPAPKRWFAYTDLATDGSEADDRWPANHGEGHTTLRDAVDWAERRTAAK